MRIKGTTKIGGAYDVYETDHDGIFIRVYSGEERYVSMLSMMSKIDHSALVDHILPSVKLHIYL